MKESTRIVSNVWFRQIELEKVGDEYGGHSHVFDHMHLLCVGEVDITIEDVTTRFKAPQMIFIEKGKDHSMVAVSDKTLGFCIHPIRDGAHVEDIVDPSSLPDNFSVLQWAEGVGKYTRLLEKHAYPTIIMADGTVVSMGEDYNDTQR